MHDDGRYPIAQTDTATLSLRRFDNGDVGPGDSRRDGADMTEDITICIPQDDLKRCIRNALDQHDIKPEEWDCLTADVLANLYATDEGIIRVPLGILGGLLCEVLSWHGIEGDTQDRFITDMLLDASLRRLR